MTCTHVIQKCQFFGKYYIFVVDFSPILPVDIIVAEEMHFPICNEVNFWGGGLFEMKYLLLFMSIIADFKPALCLTCSPHLAFKWLKSKQLKYTLKEQIENE